MLSGLDPSQRARKAHAARLNAAAPQLYDALKRITHPAADDGDVQHALDVLAAIDAPIDPNP
jgi:hypothetical protein